MYFEKKKKENLELKRGVIGGGKKEREDGRPLPLTPTKKDSKERNVPKKF